MNFAPNLTPDRITHEDYYNPVELIDALPEGVLDELERIWRDDEKRQYTLAVAELQKLRRINDILDETLLPETAMGRSLVKVPTYLWNMWGERIGFDALREELPNFIRDTPELQRPNLPKKPTFLVDGFKQEVPAGAIVDKNGRAA